MLTYELGNLNVVSQGFNPGPFNVLVKIKSGGGRAWCEEQWSKTGVNLDKDKGNGQCLHCLLLVS